ncbi:histone acetylation protein-domain-containing protein [Melanogaster broomeanus]|nr:histone acetylation protein-domain-containing protein [Melanogaster broomeanus]
MNLRDALLEGLAKLPGTREFHIHVLVSSPRKHSNLYPYAVPRPKTYLQEILVLLSEQPTPDSPRVFVSAIEASLYHVPSTASAVLYVSKVDSTGQARTPSPTPALVRAFLTYYASPTTRPLSVDHLWIHLFARAQSQYLFPNSADFPGKRPLTDVKLCAWWKRQFTMVAEDMLARVGAAHRLGLFYMLPGLGELEAFHSLERSYSSQSPNSVPWVYGHPYCQTDIPLPCTSNESAGKSHHLGHVIPWFDDDPKARFLDEIAYTTDAEGVKSPERKRPRIDRDILKPEEDAESGSDKKNVTSVKEEHTTKSLKKVSIEEFWERMSFRQECIAGALTGFFVMAISCLTQKPPSRSEPSPLAPHPGQVSPQMVKRVLTSLMTGHEFPSVERAAWSTRVLEESIKGLCNGLKTVPSPEITLNPDESGRRTPEPNPAPATLAPPQTPPPRLVNGKRPVIDVSPNPFPEPVASLETYNMYIYGSLTVRNPDEPRKDFPAVGDSKGAITVLAARKKKRPKP